MKDYVGNQEFIEFCDAQVKSLCNRIATLSCEITRDSNTITAQSINGRFVDYGEIDCIKESTRSLEEETRMIWCWRHLKKITVDHNNLHPDTMNDFYIKRVDEFSLDEIGVRNKYASSLIRAKEIIKRELFRNELVPVGSMSPFEDRLRSVLSQQSLDITSARKLVNELRVAEESWAEISPGLNDLWMRLSRRIEKDTR
jgi:hypothetical protein